MLTKNDFSAPDWNTLRNTQHLVGFAMVMTGSSGLGTIKELAALSQQIIQSQASDVPLIRDLTSTSEMKAAQASLKQVFDGQETKPTVDGVRRLALDGAQSSLAILGPKASKEETDAYRQLLYSIADKVAHAAREGGFLGFGGTLVSEGEQAFLDQLRSTLQLDRVKSA
jgi:hypothetical protein